MDGELEALCQACGLCCDGSLFQLVPLARSEIALAERHRPPIVGGGKGFEQSCPRLAIELSPSGTRRGCEVYADRPRACRAFVCRLYDRHRRERGSVEGRIAEARRARALIDALRASGHEPSDFEGDPKRGSPSPELADAYAELVRRLEDDFARVVSDADVP